jgi:hypothetical protein
MLRPMMRTSPSRLERDIRRGLLVLMILGLALAATGPVRAQSFRLLEIDGLRLKWGSPDLGAGATVSWGLAEAPASFPDAINCRALAPLSSVPALAALPGDALPDLVERAFTFWSAAAGIEFRRARSGGQPDILIGAQGEPRRIAFANVWWDKAAARNGIAPLTRATICLNPERPWSAARPAPPGHLDLVYALAHEIGHAIGLDHPGPTGALMGYRNAGVEHLLPGDIAGARVLYGMIAPRLARSD